MRRNKILPRRAESDSHQSVNDYLEDTYDRSLIGWNLELKDEKLNAEFAKVYTDRKYNLTILERLYLALIVLTVASVNAQTIYLNWKEGTFQTFYRPIILALATTCTLLPITSVWVMLFIKYQTKSNNNAGDFSNNESSLESETRYSSAIKWFILGYMFTTSYQLCLQVYQGSCGDTKTYLSTYCNYYADLGLMPVVSTPVFLSAPLIISYIFPEIPYRLLFIGWVAQSISLFFSVLYIRSYESFFQMVTLFFPYTFMLYTSCRDRLLVFLVNSNLQAIKERAYQEKMQLIEQNNRSMAANTAHDLKTPLSSIMSGLELIKLTILDIKSLPMKTKTITSTSTDDNINAQNNTTDQLLYSQYYDHLLEMIADLHNLNLFMMSSINRYQDNARIGQGMKLIPQLETFHLFEALLLPVKCMRDTQTKVKITLIDLPIETNEKSPSDDDTDYICEYIISDKQWLQENILCLLSNAVKYSMGGEATISVKKVILQSSVLDTAFSTSKRTRPPGSSPTSLKVQKNRLVKNSQASIPEIPIISPKRSMSKSFRGAENSIRSVSYDFATREYLRFEVADEGIGMSEEAMKSLFSPFQQTQRLAGGTGLGLYSLYKRVEALQGECGVLPRTDGQKGSIFWFTIPYKPDTAMKLMMIDDERDNNNYHQQVLSSSKPIDMQSVSVKRSQREVVPSENPIIIIEENQKEQEIDINTLIPMNRRFHTSDISMQFIKNKQYSYLFPNIDSVSNDRTEISSLEIKQNHHQIQSNTSMNTSTYSISVREPERSSVQPQEELPCVVAAPLVSSTVRPLRVLLVEDTPSIAKVTVMMLRRLQYEVIHVDNGERALEVIKKSIETTTEVEGLSHTKRNTIENNSSCRRTSFDFILMDLQMPILDGLETTKRIRKLETEYSQQNQILSDESIHHIIIALSAAEDDDTISAAQGCGCDGFLSKPIEAQPLNDLLSELLSKKKFTNPWN